MDFDDLGSKARSRSSSNISLTEQIGLIENNDKRRITMKRGTSKNSE